jgi:truncated hemoglobin YjbI
MAMPRRRIIRPHQEVPLPSATEQRRQQRLRARLESQRAAFERWWKRLRRALTAVEKSQRTIKTLERQLAQGETANGQDH